MSLPSKSSASTINLSNCQQRNESLVKIIKKVNSGIVKIQSSNYVGSGFVVHQLENQTLILTNKQVTGNDSKVKAKENLIKSSSQDTTYSKTPDINNDIRRSQSTVSFNNSKNFSIYNSMNKDSKEQLDSKSLDVKDFKEENTSSSFKDRLNQIDMK